MNLFVADDVGLGKTIEAGLYRALLMPPEGAPGGDPRAAVGGGPAA
ncbi:MAG: hypothetical protein IPG17_30410 [Sandaracinaceae bacterium]|nr:hypothetical protein [Sandaracinaceae bacterium]